MIPKVAHEMDCEGCDPPYRNVPLLGRARDDRRECLDRGAVKRLLVYHERGIRESQRAVIRRTERNGCSIIGPKIIYLVDETRGDRVVRATRVREPAYDMQTKRAQ